MNPNENIKYLIFTDLDGTLLNHEDYSYEEAKEMLHLINSRKIPLIFTTSKTRLETEELQKELNITAPFIVENGAAIYFPKNNCTFSTSDMIERNAYRLIRLGEEYAAITAFIDKYKEDFEIYAFHDMNVKEVMAYTGLDLEDAQKAKHREFTEPFVIKDERRLTAFEKLAEAHAMKIIKGGRFYHCIGIGQDKGKAVERTIAMYQQQSNQKITSIALGDNYNDVDMLKEVDIPILIPHHLGKYIDVNIPNLIKAPYKGSLGWNTTLKEVLLSES